MATIAINRYQPIFDRTKKVAPMKQKRELAEVIEKVRNLLELQSRTGFRTTRSVGALLADLSPDELAEVNRALNQQATR